MEPLNLKSWSSLQVPFSAGSPGELFCHTFVSPTDEFHLSGGLLLAEHVSDFQASWQHLLPADATWGNSSVQMILDNDFWMIAKRMSREANYGNPWCTL